VSTPADLKYTAEHEWVRVVGDHVRVGITDYAQESLGDIVFVTLPAVGTQVAPGDSFGEVESTKSVSDLFAPLAGVVVARNEELDAHPELVNSDPYGEGWMVDIAPEGGVLAALGAAHLLDAAAYQALIGR
jgi:glycine cleavage system H protein